MATEKMKLVKVSGPLNTFNSVCVNLIESESFHPSSASKSFSSGMGFVPFADDSNYSKSLAQLNEIAEKSGVPLNLVKLSEQSDLEDIESEYISEIEETVQSIRGPIRFKKRLMSVM